MLALSARPALLGARLACTAPTQRRPARVTGLSCRAEAREQQDTPTWRERLAAPAAAVLGAALLFAATPDVAEAARSGGRVGGSSGFSRARAAPAPAKTAPRVTNNTNVIVAPMGGYGFGMPFFGGGFGFGYPMFGFGLSSIFSLMVLLFVVNFIVSVASGFTNQKKKNEFSDDEW